MPSIVATEVADEAMLMIAANERIASALVFQITTLWLPGRSGPSPP